MKLIIYILLIFFVYKIFKYLAAPSASSERKIYRKADAVDDVMVKDPVCEVYFPKKDGVSLNFSGKEMCFCSPECRDKFVELTPIPGAGTTKHENTGARSQEPE